MPATAATIRARSGPTDCLRRISCSTLPGVLGACWRVGWSRSCLHAPGRHVHPTRNAHRDRESRTSRLVHFRAREFQPRFGRARGRNLLSEFHLVARGPGSCRPRKRGFGEIDLRTAGSGKENCSQGKDRRVPRVRQQCAGISLRGLSLRNAGVRNRGIKESPLHRVDWPNMPSILAEISFVSKSRR